MMILTKYSIGDTVRVGPNEGRVIRITIGSREPLYAVVYWHENQAVEYVAYEWELVLVSAHSMEGE